MSKQNRIDRSVYNHQTSPLLLLVFRLTNAVLRLRVLLKLEIDGGDAEVVQEHLEAGEQGFHAMSFGGGGGSTATTYTCLILHETRTNDVKCFDVR